MKLNKLALICMICLALGSWMAAAVKPNTIIERSGSLLISYPPNEIYLRGLDANLYFHIFNSTGSALANTSVNCSIHVYNNSGNHIIEDKMLSDSNGVDLFYTIPAVYTQNIGEIPFIVWCDAPANNEAGSIETTLTIADNTFLYDPIRQIAFIFMILVVILVLFSFANTMKDSEDGFAQPIRLFIYLIGLFFLVLASGMGVKMMQLSNIAESYREIGGIFYIMLLFVVIPLILLFLVRFIIALMQFMRSQEQNKGGGWK